MCVVDHFLLSECVSVSDSNLKKELDHNGGCVVFDIVVMLCLHPLAPLIVIRPSFVYT